MKTWQTYVSIYVTNCLPSLVKFEYLLCITFIARVMRAIHCAKITMVSNWPQVPFRMIPSMVYVYHRKIVSKSHLNKDHYTNSAEFPPEPNTFRLWRHFFQTAFRPLNVPFFFLEKFAVTCRVSNTQGTSWPDFWNWSRGPFKTPFCPIHLFLHHMFR